MFFGNQRREKRFVSLIGIKILNNYMSQPLRVKVRIIVVGERETGKTCFIKKFIGEESSFRISKKDLNQSRTFAFKGYHKNLSVIDGILFDLDIWDTYKGETYDNLTELFTRDAKACFIVCDVTNEESIEATKEWADVIKERVNKDTMKIPMFLIGNKIDLEKIL